MLGIFWAFTELQYFRWWRFFPQCYWLLTDKVVVAKSWCACGIFIIIFLMSFATLLTLPFMKDFSITSNAVWEHFTYRTSSKTWINLLKPCWSLINYICNILTSLLSFKTISSLRVDSISRNYLLSLLLLITSLGYNFNSCSLFTISVVTSPACLEPLRVTHECWNQLLLNSY